MTDFARMRALAQEICTIVEQKDKDYGSSWRRRGGPGAFMVMIRKADRIENLASKANYDIFNVLGENTGNIVDDMQDLIGYLLLILEHAGYAPPTESKITLSGESFNFPLVIDGFNKTFSLPTPTTPTMYLELDRNIGALGRLLPRPG